MSFGYGENGVFRGSYKSHAPAGWGNGEDNFIVKQRTQIQLEAIISQRLSGYLAFESGDIIWGQGATGAALGADQDMVKVNQAYIDWKFPKAPVETRMGLQSITLPALASGNSILSDTMAGITTSVMFGESFTITAIWARPYNDNYPGYANGKQKNFLDNMDAFALVAPVTLANVNLIPYGMYAAIGPNTFRGAVTDGGFPFGNYANMGTNANHCLVGIFPAGGARHSNFSNANTATQLTMYGQGWWGGFTGYLNRQNPWHTVFDFEYGHVWWQNAGRFLRRGWFASVLMEYSLDWGIPGIYGWYGSGDDANPANGSERMPSLEANAAGNYSRFALDGAPYMERNGLIANNLAGLWGVGFRLNDIRYPWNFKHVMRINLIGGTNSPAMAKKMSLAGMWATGFQLDDSTVGNAAVLGMPGVYMTTRDYAVELGISSYCKIAENLSVSTEAAYLALFLDTSKNCWGARHSVGKSIPATKNAWNLNTSLIFSF